MGTAGGAVQRSGTPLTVNGATLAINAGGKHTCATTPSGTVSCWGSGFYGQLGNGGTLDSPLPVKVVNTDQTVGAAVNVVNVGLGFEHTCGVYADGDAKCWGRNNLVQLGTNIISTDLPQAETPRDVYQMSSAMAIASGSAHSCVVLFTGQVQCWGNNNFRQTGYDQPALPAFPATRPGNHHSPDRRRGVRAHLRGTDFGQRAVRGQGRPGPARQRGHGQFGRAGDRDRHHDGHGGIPRRFPQLCPPRRRRPALLGSQCRGPARQRHDDPVVGPGRRQRHHHRQFDRCRRLPHLRAPLDRGGPVLGRGDVGQLGNGFFVNISSPVVVTGLAGAVNMDAGQIAHLCRPDWWPDAVLGLQRVRPAR